MSVFHEGGRPRTLPSPPFTKGEKIMRQFPSDVAFTPAVKRIQSEKGSRTSYSKVEQNRGWNTCVPKLGESFELS
jgi:hypothetical protein